MIGFWFKVQEFKVQGFVSGFKFQVSGNERSDLLATIHFQLTLNSKRYTLNYPDKVGARGGDGAGEDEADGVRPSKPEKEHLRKTKSQHHGQR